MKIHLTKLSAALLAIFSPTSHANNHQNTTLTNDPSQNFLTPIVLQAVNNHYTTGNETYNSSELNHKNKNISDFLETHTNIQFSQDHSNPSTQNTLQPAEISINGAQSFQNQFLVNGVSNNHLIDPAKNDNNPYNHLSTGSQGLALNTNLLCELDVLDSNISAEYGSFMGGVVSAKICAPDTQAKQFHGHLSYDYTQNDWLYLFSNQISSSNQTLNTSAPEYKQHGLSANTTGMFNEIWGISTYFSTRESVIPVSSGLNQPHFFYQNHQNQNFGTTLFYTPSDQLNAKFGSDYGVLNNVNYIQSRRFSRSDVHQKTWNAFAEIEQKFKNFKLIHKLNYQSMNSMRDSENNYGIMWHYAQGSKDWDTNHTLSEGAILGDLELKQSSYTYAIKAQFQPSQFAFLQHQPILGFGYEHLNASWQRNTDVYGSNISVLQLHNLGQAQCLENDPWCDATPTYQGWNGQYISTANLYKAGQFKTQQNHTYAYAEDQITWQNLNVRLGIRADHDSLSNNLDFAPRSTIRYQPFTDHALIFTSGWNRYYGVHTLNTELYDSIGALQYKMSRSSPSASWVLSPQSNSNSTRRSDLDTPYADERVFALNTQLNQWNLELKWVNRTFKDEISRTRTDVENNGIKFSYHYANDGQGQADTYSLSIVNQQPFHWASSTHNFRLGIDYNQVFRSYADYNQNFDLTEQERFVYYNGKVMRWSDRPATDFNQPWTARATWDIQLKKHPITIHHFFNYKSAYNDMIQDFNLYEYQGDQIDVYSVQKIKPKFSWDLRTTYRWQLGKDYATILGLTIENLTNQRHHYVDHSSMSTQSQISTVTGRQLTADLSFKF